MREIGETVILRCGFDVAIYAGEVTEGAGVEP